MPKAKRTPMSCRAVTITHWQKRRLPVDPNWGRIVSAAGYAGVSFGRTGFLRVSGLNSSKMRRRSVLTPKSIKSIRENREIVDINLGDGPGTIRFYTSDLTAEHISSMLISYVVKDSSSLAAPGCIFCLFARLIEALRRFLFRRDFVKCCSSTTNTQLSTPFGSPKSSDSFTPIVFVTDPLIGDFRPIQVVIMRNRLMTTSILVMTTIWRVTTHLPMKILTSMISMTNLMMTSRKKKAVLTGASR